MTKPFSLDLSQVHFSRPLYSKQDFADHLNVTLAVVNGWIAREQIPYIKIGRRVFIVTNATQAGSATAGDAAGATSPARGAQW